MYIGTLSAKSTVAENLFELFETSKEVGVQFQEHPYSQSAQNYKFDDHFPPYYVARNTNRHGISYCWFFTTSLFIALIFGILRIFI